MLGKPFAVDTLNASLFPTVTQNLNLCLTEGAVGNAQLIIECSVNCKIQENCYDFSKQGHGLWESYFTIVNVVTMTGYIVFCELDYRSFYDIGYRIFSKCSSVIDIQGLKLWPGPFTWCQSFNDLWLPIWESVHVYVCVWVPICEHMYLCEHIHIVVHIQASSYLLRRWGWPCFYRVLVKDV